MRGMSATLKIGGKCTETQGEARELYVIRAAVSTLARDKTSSAVVAGASR